MRIRAPRIGVKALLGLIACCALLFSAQRTFWETTTQRWQRILRELNQKDTEPNDDWDSLDYFRIHGYDVDGATVTSLLIPALRDPNPRFRASVAGALASFGPYGAAAIPELIARLRDKDTIVRTNAVAALGEILVENDWARESALPAMAGLLKDPHVHVRMAAAGALIRNHEGERAIPTLIDALADHDAHVRRSAARWLGRRSVAAKAETAIPSLIAAMKDRDVHVRLEAAHSLIVIGEVAAAYPVVLELIHDDDDSVHSRASWILASGGPNGKAGVPLLIEATKDKLSRVRVAAASALIVAGEPEVAIPVLLEVIRRWDDPAHSEAEGASFYFSPKDQAAIPALRQALNDESAVFERFAKEALERIGPSTAEMRPE